MVASITADSVKRLGLKVGDDVTAVVKASSVMLAK
jgi:molybdopterin-binding protein